MLTSLGSFNLRLFTDTHLFLLELLCPNLLSIILDCIYVWHFLTEVATSCWIPIYPVGHDARVSAVAVWPTRTPSFPPPLPSMRSGRHIVYFRSSSILDVLSVQKWPPLLFPSAAYTFRSVQLALLYYKSNSNGGLQYKVVEFRLNMTTETVGAYKASNLPPDAEFLSQIYPSIHLPVCLIDIFVTKSHPPKSRIRRKTKPCPLNWRSKTFRRPLSADRDERPN